MTAGRRLGKHMPRIASGDGNEDHEAEAREHNERQKPSSRPLPREPESPRAESSRRYVEEQSPTSAHRAVEARLNGQSNGNGARAPIPSQWDNRKTAPPPLTTPTARPVSQDLSFPSLSSGEDVAGVPGRLHLSRNASAPPTPLKTRPMSGLWADVQRHLIQAYEYMCHVGEAQQWIEGCLGEELGFGVVEMDEGLRNGVVLARLAQVWDGASVRKIFDVSPKQFYNSFLMFDRILDLNSAGGIRTTLTTFLSLFVKSGSQR